MMEKFYNIFKKALVLIGVISMTSCDYLETEPYDFVSPTTFYRNESECNMALAAVYYPMATANLYGNFYATEMTNIDDLSYYTRNSGFSGQAMGKRLYQYHPRDMEHLGRTIHRY